MKAPIPPPSNRIVKPGQRRRCASVAARSGMPTPANTSCPSLSWRALKIASSSVAVWLCALSIVNARSGARRFEQFVRPDQSEKFAPRFRPVDERFKILLHACHRLLVHQSDIVLHVPEHRLVNPIAFPRGASEGELDNVGNPKKWNLCLVRGPPNLILVPHA